MDDTTKTHNLIEHCTNAMEAAESRGISLEQLVNEHVDIKRWINTSLKVLLPPEEDIAENDTEVEACVVQLFNRLQGYLHEVSGSVEDTIAQALVRLPRTGLEVGRMVTEAQLLQQQLQGMQEVVHSAVEAAAKPYVAQLNALKKTEEKLHRCANTLKKASEVDSNMKQLDDFMHQLRTATSEVDMNAVAEAISQVRRNLAEIQKLDVTFGEKQLETVERHEQTVQHAVEVECLEMLRRQDVERAGHLLNVLDMIGRVDVVLQKYAQESMTNEKKRVEQLLCVNSTSVTMSPSHAAEVLKRQLMPSISHALWCQLDYLLCMVQLEEVANAGSDDTSLAPSNPCRAEARTVKVLQLMVDEVKNSIGPALELILEQAEGNRELIACYDAMRQLKLGTEASINKNDNSSKNNSGECNALLKEKLSNQTTAYALSEMTQLCSKPNILEAFAKRESCRIETLLKDPQSPLRRERFHEVMSILTDGVKDIVHFFPEKTLPMCVKKWREVLIESISSLHPTSQTSQESLLERFSSASAMVRQLLVTQKTTEDYLASPELQRVCPALADTVNNQLCTQLWTPLEESLNSCLKGCQQALKSKIIEPVLAKAAGYDVQPMWKPKQIEGSSSTGMSLPISHAPAQIAPSKLVRALGEAIVEIPLTLEALRGDGDGDSLHDGIEELLEEVASFWLDDIVRTAVVDFIEKKVSPITIYFPTTFPDAVKKEAAAVEQLVTDLNYLKSILSAVSGDTFEGLERALAKLKAVSLPSGKPIAIYQLICGDA